MHTTTPTAFPPPTCHRSRDPDRPSARKSTENTYYHMQHHAYKFPPRYPRITRGRPTLQSSQRPASRGSGRAARLYRGCAGFSLSYNDAWRAYKRCDYACMRAAPFCHVHRRIAKIEMRIRCEEFLRKGLWLDVW